MADSHPIPSIGALSNGGSILDRHPDLARLVEHFYGLAQADALLGPIFAAQVQDWPHHYRALTAFWAAQLRGRGSYRGTPLAAHRAIATRLSPLHFVRWLELWEAATLAIMPPQDAQTLQERAKRIALVLQTAMATP